MKFKKYLKKKHKPKPRENTGRWMPGMNPGYSALILPESLVITESKIEFYDELTGYRSGQKDMRLSAIVDSKKAGYIDYTIYGKEVSIKFIEVNKNFRRQGIGKELVLKLQSLFPKTEIELGMLTGEGAALVNAIKSKLYVDQARLRKIEKLRKEYETLKKKEDQAIKTNNWEKWDNSIYDRMYDIEQELSDLS